VKTRATTATPVLVEQLVKKKALDQE